MIAKRCWQKLVQLLFSWKFHLLALSTYLFVKGTLSENGWLIMASATTGLRELVNLVSMKLGGTSQEPSNLNLSDKDRDIFINAIDNPDAVPVKKKK